MSVNYEDAEGFEYNPELNQLSEDQINQLSKNSGIGGSGESLHKSLSKKSSF